MPQNSNDVLVRFIADTTNLLSGIAKADKALNGMSTKVGMSMKSMAGVVGVASAVIGSAVGVAVTNATKDAIKFESLMDNISVTMGASADDFVKWQETTGTAMGYSKVQSAELANTLSTNFSQIATSQQDLFNKTTKMMEVASIIRARTGRTMQDVSDRIRSAMNQEADGADELGINVRTSAIQQSNAYKQMADGKPWADLSTNMQKAILYQYILEESARKYGTELGSNTSVKTAELSARLADLKLKLGQAFLPIWNRVLPALISFASAMDKVLGKVEKFMEHVFGYKHKNQTAEDVKKTTQETVKLGKAVDNVAKSKKKLDSTNKKKDNGFIASFDEVHTINKLNEAINGATSPSVGGGSTSSSSSSGGSSGGANIPFNDNHTNTDPEDYSYLDSIIKRLKDSWDRLVDSTNKFWDSLVNLGNTPFMKMLGEGVVETAVRLVVASFDLLGNVLDILADDFNFIADILNGDWGKAWKDLKKGVSDTYDLFGDFIVDILGEDWGGKLQVQFDDFKKWCGDVTAKAEEFVKNVFTSDGLGKAWNGALNYLKNIDIKEWFSKNVTNKINDAFNGMGSIGYKVWHNTIDYIGSLGDKITTWFSNGLVSPIWKAIGGLGTIGSKIWEYVRKGWGDIKGWFDKNIVGKIKSAFTGMSSGLGGTITSVFKVVFNQAVDFLNKFISMYDKVRDYSVFGKKPFAKLPHIQPLKKLYNGGITNGKTIAQIGDNVGGREVVSPLDQLRGMIATTMAQTLSMKGGGGTGGGDVVLQIDGRTFARVIQPYQNMEANRTGTNLRMSTI